MHFFLNARLSGNHHASTRLDCVACAENGCPEEKLRGGKGVKWLVNCKKTVVLFVNSYLLKNSAKIIYHKKQQFNYYLVFFVHQGLYCILCYE